MLTPLQENKLVQAVLKAVSKGQGKRAIAIAAKKDRKLGMKVKDIVQSIFSLQSDISKLRKKNPKLAKAADAAYKELGL
jgi:hypothetical protein|tara:strand:+ start:288 stop:524 length:237 start_codon:yes stop_codon:yes gene_type:complete